MSERAEFHIFNEWGSAHAMRHLRGELSISCTSADKGLLTKTVLPGDPDYDLARRAYNLVWGNATEKSL